MSVTKQKPTTNHTRRLLDTPLLGQHSFRIELNYRATCSTRVRMFLTKVLTINIHNTQTMTIEKNPRYCSDLWRSIYPSADDQNTANTESTPYQIFDSTRTHWTAAESAFTSRSSQCSADVQDTCEVVDDSSMHALREGVARALRRIEAGARNKAAAKRNRKRRREV